MKYLIRLYLVCGPPYRYRFNLEMSKQLISVISKITPYLDLSERAFLIGIALGLIPFTSNGDSKILLQVSLLGLAITYFLSSFRMTETPPSEVAMGSMKSLLVWTIAPKNLWMFCSISLFGLFVYTLQLGNDSDKRLFIIGGGGIAFCLAILAYGFLSGTKHLKVIMPLALKAIPLLLLDFWLLYN